MKKRHKWQHTKFKGKDGEYHISFSTCTECGVKRKIWRHKPTHYQHQDGSSEFGKAPICTPVYKKYHETHTIEKRGGVEVDLKELDSNQLVVAGDGETFHFLLTKKAEIMINQPTC